MSKKATDYTPDPKNANKGTERGLYLLEQSVSETGLGRSIVVDKNGVVIAGNKTLQAAIDAGLVEVVEVPTDGKQLVVVRRTDLDLSEDERARKLAYFDNRAGEVGLEWDSAQLLADLEAGFDLSGMFREDELEELLSGLERGTPVANPGPQIDRAEELREEWRTERGQVWEIGDHRLIVGNVLDDGVLDRLMQGEKATLLFTDPPYGVSVGAKNRMLNAFQPAGRRLEDIEADDLNADDLYALLKAAFILARRVLADDCSVFVCAPQGGNLGLMMMMMKDAGLEIRHVLNWVKNQPTFSLGRLDYEYQHEPILFTWVKTHKRYKNGQYQTSTWFVDKPTANRDHPTIKPVELYENAILNHTDSGDIVLDIFAGSGTALVASERRCRAGRAVELMPQYSAVALQRLADMGLEPRLING